MATKNVPRTYVDRTPAPVPAGAYDATLHATAANANTGTDCPVSSGAVITGIRNV
jgi:hypothetical protein